MELQPLKPFSISPYRVSTITLTGSINTCVDLANLFDAIIIDENEHHTLRYVEYGLSKSDADSKGVAVKKMKRTVNKPKKRFDNQMTLHFVCDDIKYNVKLFKNGNVQMTGVKNISSGTAIIDELIAIVKFYHNRPCSVVDDSSKLKNCKTTVCLMNCDFKIHFNIDRMALHKVLVMNGLACTYEPCIYQGVKLSYFMSDRSSNGVCSCTPKCIGKGSKTYCERVTVAFFQSGSVTINGARNSKQLDELYEFVKRTISKYSEHIQQKFYKPAAAVSSNSM